MNDRLPGLRPRATELGLRGSPPLPAARRPPPVRPGDTVAVAALSSRVDEERLERGVRALGELGFRVRRAANLASGWGRFAGSDEGRLAALHELVRDPDLKAIFFARGGHGVLRVLERVDWDLLARFPKAYVGFSDVTPFLGQVVDRLGLEAYHGPMVAAELAAGLVDEERTRLLEVLAGPGPNLWSFEAGEGSVVEGRLIGGCLSLLTATLGTDYFPRLEDAILFLEDTNEPFHRLDRMLTHLRVSGSLHGLKGMILGYLEPVDGNRDELLMQLRNDFGTSSLAWGLAAGHGRPNLALRLGAAVRLDPGSRRLEVIGEEP